jgi:hypothetical protein
MVAEGEYLLDWIIEPLAGILEAITGWEHEKAVKWVKGFVYLGLLGLVLAVGWKLYRWIFPKKKD